MLVLIKIESSDIYPRTKFNDNCQAGGRHDGHTGRYGKAPPSPDTQEFESTIFDNYAPRSVSFARFDEPKVR